MGNRPPATADACKSIKLPLGVSQAFITALCDAFTDGIILECWACLSIGASCSIICRQSLSWSRTCGWNRSKSKRTLGFVMDSRLAGYWPKSLWRVSFYLVSCLAPRCWFRVRPAKTHHHCQRLLDQLRQILRQGGRRWGPTHKQQLPSH